MSPSRTPYIYIYIYPLFIKDLLNNTEPRFLIERDQSINDESSLILIGVNLNF
jgi:hypothetical protein